MISVRSYVYYGYDRVIGFISFLVFLSRFCVIGGTWRLLDEHITLLHVRSQLKQYVKLKFKAFQMQWSSLVENLKNNTVVSFKHLKLGQILF